MKKIVFFIFHFTFLSLNMQSQNIKWSGYILDALSNETLPMANVCVVSASTQCNYSNDFGYFSMNLPRQKDIDVEISYMGYQKMKISCRPNRDSFFNIKLLPEANSLGEVEVREKNSILSHGVVSLPIEKLKSIPMMAGEPDVIKALAFLPGVQSGVEGTTGLYVRGGTSDQNLVLLDGSTVYNTSHLFGFLSVFNPNALKSLNFYKGNFPARFGGRLSSVIDITMKEGNSQKKEREVSIGTISSSFLIEGPIKNNKSSYILSARTAYLGLLALPSYLLYKSNKKDTYQNFLMYDFNAKTNFQISPKDKIFISAYAGNDYWINNEKTRKQSSMNKLNWGNKTAAVRYTRIVKPNLFFNAMANYNEFSYISDINSRDSTNDINVFFNSTSSVKDATVKFNLDWQQNTHFVRTGLEIAAHQFKPQFTTIQSKSEAFDSTIRSLNTKQFPTSFAYYVDDEIQLNSKIKCNIGLRYAIYNTQGTNFNSFEPRLSINYRFNLLSNIEFSFVKMQQPIHLLSNSNFGLANDIWVPATKNTPPQQGRQFSLGYSYDFKRINTTVQTDIFYKRMNNQIDYRQGVNFFYDAKEGWEKLIEKNGIGRAYGIEFLIQRELEDRNFIISYTLSYNYRKFSKINQGEWYPQKYDRRHNLSVLYEKQLANKKWKFFSNFVFMTGNAVTLPNVAHYDLFFEEVKEVYEARNNKRMPIYNRLDIGFTKSYKTKKNNDAKLSFNIYNTYAYPNAVALNYTSHTTYSGNNIPYSFNPKIYKVSLFRFIPGINYSIKF